MVELLDVTSTSPEHWHYISEGGATIVFSYRGPPSTAFSGTVLRLRKTKIPPLPNQAYQDSSANSKDFPIREGSEEKDENEINEPDDPSVEFQHRITSKLIPPTYLPRLESVLVKSPWLTALRKLTESERPHERRHVDTIDINRRKAVIATDLVGGSSWTVEIKPKWGFLPNPMYLSPETSPVKSRYCRFCMHSQLRVGQSNATNSLAYCPLDLYSGKDSRVVHALRCLWDVWMHSGGTANNLRIFVHGKVLNPIDASEILAPLLSLPKGVNEETLSMAFAASLLPLLQETSVLQRLAQLQRTLDAFDIEGIRELYNLTITSAETETSNNRKKSQPLEHLFPQPTFDDWESFTDTYLSNGVSDTTFLNEDLRAPADLKKLQYYVMAYLLSATFKDCSIMLRPGIVGSVHNSVTVIDLDPKPMTSLKKWEEMDHVIAASFKRDGVEQCLDENLKSLG